MLESDRVAVHIDNLQAVAVRQRHGEPGLGWQLDLVRATLRAYPREERRTRRQNSGHRASATRKERHVVRVGLAVGGVGACWGNGIAGDEGARRMLNFVDRITVNPKQMGGVPCIRGLRIAVATVVGMVADGLTVEEIVAELPPLEPEDVRAALRYAAETVADRELPLRTTA